MPFQSAVFLAGCKDGFQGQSACLEAVPARSPSLALSNHPWRDHRAKAMGWHVGLCLWRCSSGGGVNESPIKAGGRAQRTRRGILTVRVAGRANTFHTAICSCGEKNWKWQAGGFTFASVGLFLLLLFGLLCSALRFWGWECFRCLSLLFLQLYIHFP